MKILILFFVLFANPTIAELSFGPNYRDVSQIKNLKVDLRYATKNNFTHQKVYTHLSHAFLHKIAYEKLVIAAKKLEQVKPKWKLIVFDALRPRSAQRKLYQVVQGTPEAKYVMDPEKGSFHNYGFAIDIGLLDEMGKEVDMGTGFDDFTVLAEPKKESENLKAGTLTTLQLAHRKILRDCMEGAGFTELPIEWWHFDAISRAELKNYPIVE